MRPYLITLVLIPFFSCRKPQKNSLKEWNLNGEVERVSLETYKGKYEGGQWVEEEKPLYRTGIRDHFEAIFDREGFLTEIMYGMDELTDTDRYEYRDGRQYRIYRSEEQISAFGDSYQEMSTIEWIYRNGLLVKEITRDQRGDTKILDILYHRQRCKSHRGYTI